MYIVVISLVKVWEAQAQNEKDYCLLASLLLMPLAEPPWWHEGVSQCLTTASPECLGHCEMLRRVLGSCSTVEQLWCSQSSRSIAGQLELLFHLWPIREPLHSRHRQPKYHRPVQSVQKCALNRHRYTDMCTCCLPSITVHGCTTPVPALTMFMPCVCLQAAIALHICSPLS